MIAPDLATKVLDAARGNGTTIATAESCTGGMIAAALTDIAGSSDVFERGFVTYSNDAKMDLLGVGQATLDAHGAVSSETARAMAEGALRNSRAGIAVSVTGVAGPGGGSGQKPVGLVWFGLAQSNRAAITRECRFEDRGRAFIRQQSVEFALSLLLETLEQSQATP